VGGDAGFAPRQVVGPRRRVSMADVAARAGVSGQTVSRVVNGSPRVDPATRARIEQAMAVLGYRPHRAARALRTGRTQTVGLVATSLAQVGNSRMLQAVADAAAARSYALVVVTIRPDEGIAGAFERLRDQGVDGAIVLNEATVLAREADAPVGLELVVVDSPEDGRFPSVQADHRGGAGTATAHLLAEGHDTVWHVAGPGHSFAATERERGWRDALTAAGRVVPEVLRGDWTAESGYAAGRMLAETALGIAAPGVTAVFVGNDQMALGVLRAFADRGLDVPGDVSVIGFDDLAEAAQFRPPLTTVRQDFDAIGERALGLLVDRIERAAPGNEHPDAVLIPTELVARASTAAR